MCEATVADDEDDENEESDIKDDPELSIQEEGKEVMWSSLIPDHVLSFLRCVQMYESLVVQKSKFFFFFFIYAESKMLFHTSISSRGIFFPREVPIESNNFLITN